jgi:hypothetical protein
MNILDIYYKNGTFTYNNVDIIALH